MRPRTLLRSFPRTSLPAGARQDPPTSGLLLGPPPYRGGPPLGPLRTVVGGLAQDCAPAPWGGVLTLTHAAELGGASSPLFILGHLAEPAPKASSGFHLFRQEGGDSGWSQSGRWCRVRLEAGEAEALGRMGERWVRGGEGCQPLGCPEGGKLGPGCLDQRRRFGSVIRSVFPLGKIKQRRDSGCVF